MEVVTRSAQQVEDEYRLLVSWANKRVEFLGFPSLKDERPLNLEDIYVPLSVTWQAGGRDKGERVYLPGALESARRIVVLGDPGCGKSTLVKVLAHQFGRSEPAPMARRLGPHVPIPIILRDYEIRKWKTGEDVLRDFVTQLPSQKPPEVTPEWLMAILKEGRGVLLIDGLDEAGTVSDRKRLRDQVLLPLVESSAKSLVVVTSRIVGYEEVRFDFAVSEFASAESEMEARAHPRYKVLPEDRWRGLLQRCYVAPFNEAETREFVQRWYAVREADERRRASGVASLIEAISQNARISALASNPGLLTLMALVHRVTATLPSGRVKLYDKIAEAYLETIQIYRKLPRFDASVEQMKRWMARIGWEMQLRRDSDNPFREERAAVLYWLADAIKRDRPAESEEVAKEFLDYIASRSGLLIPVSPTEFCFAHLSIQEYFAAWHLRGLITRPEQLVQRCTEHIEQPYWHETFLLLFSMLGEFPGAGDDLAWALVERSDPKRLASAAGFFSFLLAEEENGISEAMGDIARFVLGYCFDSFFLSITWILGRIPASRCREFITPVIAERLAGGPQELPRNLIAVWYFSSRPHGDWPAVLEAYIRQWSSAEWPEDQISHVLKVGMGSCYVCEWLVARTSLTHWTRFARNWLPDLLQISGSPKAALLAEVAASQMALGALGVRLGSPDESLPEAHVAVRRRIEAAAPSTARSVAMSILGSSAATEKLRRMKDSEDNWISLIASLGLLASGAGTPGLCTHYEELVARLRSGEEFSQFRGFGNEAGQAASQAIGHYAPLFGFWVTPEQFEPGSPRYHRLTCPLDDLLRDGGASVIAERRS